MANFWTILPKPFLVLAPMDDVTDYVFREIVAGLPRPDVFFTEFTSAEGLFSPGRDSVIRKFKYSENQRPIVAQIWGTDPTALHNAAKLIRDMKFDGVDINMGCPDKNVVKRGAGSAHITNQKLASEIIQAVRAGAGALPVSVKTRIGFDRVTTEEWVSFLLEQHIDALTVHGRISVEGSKNPANWEEIGKAVVARKKVAPQTVLIGNGDVVTYSGAYKLYQKYGVDGIMIGRGIFANPWVFDKTHEAVVHTESEHIALLVKHMRLYGEVWGDTKSFNVLKKFFKMYVRGFDGANELRQQLMEINDISQAETLLSKHGKNIAE